jgi:cell wall-associated NlpC family hydrolase
MVAAFVLAATSFVALIPTAAHADPIDDKRAEAAQLQDQIDANGAKQDALSEQLNGAQYRLDQAEAAIAAAQQRQAEIQQQVTDLKARLNDRAAALYKSAGSGNPVVGWDTSSAKQLSDASKYSDIVSQHDDTIVKQLKAADKDLEDQKAKAQRAEADAAKERDDVQSSLAQVQQANATQEQLLNQVNGEIADLVAQEAARREAAAQAAAAAKYTAPKGGGGGGVADAPGPGSGGAAQAIAYAQAQLGKPYCYAGTGPSCFDCSGLTMMAWGSAGVSMPHYSGAQYSSFPHVSLSALQPGDLVFWGPGGSDHVGLYIGGGQMIHAPHTGDVVRVAAVYGSPSGAVRPG